MFFLIDSELSYTYDKLLTDISTSSSYFECHKTSNLYDYFKNFLTALLLDKPVILIDADISDSEFHNLDLKGLNTPSLIHPPNITGINEMILKIKTSESIISIFTSGTTGQPKKVDHSIQSLTRNVRIGSRYENHIWGLAYSPTHMAGLQVFFQAFFNKNLIVNLFNQSRSFIYNAIEKNSITHISATPTFYRLLLPVEKRLDSVVRVTFGGEKSTSNLHESIKQLFPNSRINNIYASTEAGSLFSSEGEYFKITEDILQKIIVRNEELLIHKSLLGKSESFTFNEDYYETGDLIEWVDESERVFRFKSRKNELINIGGYKVNPLEVENEILQIPGVNQVVVFGKANSVLGNILCADIICDISTEVSELIIREKLSAKLQDFKIPRRIKFVESISLTKTGKIKRI